MKPKILLLLLGCLTGNRLIAQVHFQQGRSWQQIKIKAQKEHKYIFVDAYATWCGPCKLMDKNVYTDTVVGSVMNRLFIAVKVQMDSTKNDDSFTKAWYTDARSLARDAQIQAYPSFLFFSPKGELVQKAIGYLDPIVFLKTVLDATNGNGQLYTLLAKVKKQQLPASQIPTLLALLEKADEKTAAAEVAKEYTRDYLLKLPDQLLMQKENLLIMGRYLKKSTDPAFELFNKNSMAIDHLLGKDYSKGKIGNILLKELILPQLWRDSAYKEPISLKPNWQSIALTVKEKYGDVYAAYLIPFEQIAFYQKTKQWPELIGIYTKKMETEGIGTDGAEDNTNNVLYYIFFRYATNRTTLLKAAGWSKMIVDQHPDEPDYMDTYANLVYKAGQSKEAIEWETRAMALKQTLLQKLQKELQKSDVNVAYLNAQIKETESMKTVLKKMKAGKPTWNENSTED